MNKYPFIPSISINAVMPLAILFSLKTRMHSSRMRTGRSLSVSVGGVPGPRGGGYLVRGVYLVQRVVYLVRRVYLVWGVVPGPGGMYLVQGGCLPGTSPLGPYQLLHHPRDQTRYTPLEPDQVPPRPRTRPGTPRRCGQTHACKLITLAQLRCGR